MATQDEYHEGDLIRATNERGAKIEGKLFKTEDGRLALGAYQWTFPNWVTQNAGFSIIEVLERAPDPLPTEPGAYHDKDGDLWFLDDGGKWWDLSTMSVPISPRQEYPKAYAPFTRLYTKEEVISKARAAAWGTDPDYMFGGPERNLIERLEEYL